MDDGEVLRTPIGDRRTVDALPGIRPHRAVRRTNHPGRAILWSDHQVLHEPEPVFGTFPKAFIPWVMELLHASPKSTLHVCSGALSKDDVKGGVRIDIAMRARPDVIADGRALPFPDNTFGSVLIDPPYSVEYAHALYGTDYPRPSHLLAEAIRVVRPLGRIGFVHFLVPHPPVGSTLIAVRGVTQGCGYRIRAVTVFQKDQHSMFPETER